MTTFDDREHAFEAHFVLEESQEFQAMARRDRLLGHWVAEKLGLSAAEGDAYAQSLVREELRHPGEEDVFEKVTADLAVKGVKVTDVEIRTKMDALLSQTRREMAGL